MTKTLKHASFISIKIQGTKTRCLIDTGSHFSILSKYLATRLHVNIQPMSERNHQALFSANGSQLRLVGMVETMLDISGLKIPHTFYVCDNLTEQAILGRSFLDDASAIIDFRNKTVTISDVLQVPLQHKIHRDQFVRAKESVCIQPNAEVLLPVKCARKFNNQTVLLTAIPGQQFSRFAIASAMCQVKSNKTVCRLINCTNECLVTCADQKLAHAVIQ